jgi:hypothetical protein
LVKIKVDAGGVQFLQQADEVHKRAPQAVHGPRGHYIEVLAGHALE